MDKMDSNAIIGLVLARGGSMSVPKKNLSKLGGSTLLDRCLKTMIQSQCKYFKCKL